LQREHCFAYTCYIVVKALNKLFSWMTRTVMYMLCPRQAEIQLTFKLSIQYEKLFNQSQFVMVVDASHRTIWKF